MQRLVNLLGQSMNAENKATGVGMLTNPEGIASKKVTEAKRDRTSVLKSSS